MDLVESDKDATVEETTTRRVTDARPNNQPAGLAWLRALSMILVAIILVVLIVLFARWVYHKVNHQTVKAPGISTTSTPSTSSTKANPESGAASSGSSSSNSGQSSSSNTATNKPSSSSSTPTNQTGQLPNNGPGNVATVFVGASLIAGGAHYVITTRRSKQI